MNAAIEAMSGLNNVYYSDRKLAEQQKARHCRSGMVNKDESKELAGLQVVAKGFDEIGNVVAYSKDGRILQGVA